MNVQADLCYLGTLSKGMFSCSASQVVQKRCIKTYASGRFFLIGRVVECLKQSACFTLTFSRVGPLFKRRQKQFVLTELLPLIVCSFLLRIIQLECVCVVTADPGVASFKSQFDHMTFMEIVHEIISSHCPPSASSRRAVVSYWQNKCIKYWLTT